MRPTKQQWAMAMALVTKDRATCLRRKVGCVLLDGMGKVLSTGYNGVASGQPHCNEESPLGHHSKYPYACEGATLPSGQGLDLCEAIHAEQNALLQCSDVGKIHQCFTTASPCVTCVKLLMNTSCYEIYFMEEYPQPAARRMWEERGGKWIQMGVS